MSVTPLAFLGALALIVIPLGWLISILSELLSRAIGRLSAAPRADLSAGIALAPAILSAGVAAAISLPSLLYAAGWGEDHCAEHLHHAHLCWFHAEPLSPALAALAAALVAATLLRFGRHALVLTRLARLTRRLLALGDEATDRGVILIPTSIPICHAVGIFRPAILLSRDLAAAFPAQERAAAIAHERAHLARHDPAWSAILPLCTAAACPGLSSRWVQRWRQAAEEAADATAACAHGREVVAAALIRAARLQLDAPPLAPAFGLHGIERRVCLLLDGPAMLPAPSRIGAALLLALPAVSIAATLSADAVHHAAEAWTNSLFSLG